MNLPPIPEVIPAPKGILHLQYPSRRELTFALARVQEFYESPTPSLRGAFFSWEQWLDAHLSPGGELDYFWYWEGFNLPAKVLLSFFHHFSTELSPRELVLQDQLSLYSLQYRAGNGLTMPYLIATDPTSSPETVSHELAHAYYALDKEYRGNCSRLLAHIPLPMLASFHEDLQDASYPPPVLSDELHAYLKTSTYSELLERFPKTIAKFTWEAVLHQATCFATLIDPIL